MAQRIRVYELGRELGLTNKETLDLCNALGIGVKSHSSSIEDLQADRVRRKADREGLRRERSPAEPTANKRTARGELTPSAPTPMRIMELATDMDVLADDLIRFAPTLGIAARHRGSRLTWDQATSLRFGFGASRQNNEAPISVPQHDLSDDPTTLSDSSLFDPGVTDSIPTGLEDEPPPLMSLSIPNPAAPEAQGMSISAPVRVAELADAIGVDARTIIQLCQRNGISVRSNSGRLSENDIDIILPLLGR